jgi:hypothetical protein
MPIVVTLLKLGVHELEHPVDHSRRRHRARVVALEVRLDGLEPAVGHLGHLLDERAHERVIEVGRRAVGLVLLELAMVDLVESGHQPLGRDRFDL